ATRAVSVLVDAARFEAEARAGDRPLEEGDVWPVEGFTSPSRALRAWVAEGARVYLVVTRPPNETTGPWGPRPRLWLAGVLDAPALAGSRYVAAPNAVPIVDLSASVAALSFADSNIRYRLDATFEAPRLLEPDDEDLVRAVIAGDPTGTPKLASV